MTQGKAVAEEDREEEKHRKAIMELDWEALVIDWLVGGRCEVEWGVKVNLCISSVGNWVTRCFNWDGEYRRDVQIWVEELMILTFDMHCLRCIWGWMVVEYSGL